MPSHQRKKPQKQPESKIRFLCFQVSCTDPVLFRRHLLQLAGLSVATKFLVAFCTTFLFSSFIDLFDIGFYLQYAGRVFSGQIPYVSFDFWYPQLSFISILLPFPVALLFNSAGAYVLAHIALMCAFDLGTTILVYLVALRFSNERRAFLCGFLSATAISAAYFVLTKYDAFPAFVLLLSLALFLYGREPAGYAASAAGFLVKWFPGITYPYYLIHERLQGRDIRFLARRVLIGAVLFLVIAGPFILLSPKGFLFTYTSNAAPVNQSRFQSDSQSLSYYLDYIVSSAGGPPFFGDIVNALMILTELALLAAYWRIGSKDLKVLSSFIFAAVLAFMVLNPISSPQYIIWVTPFLALFLASSLRKILLFYAYQVWVYLEFPLTYGRLYSNYEYLAPALGGIPLAFLLFTVKFALLAVIVWIVKGEVQRSVKAERGG